MHCREAQAALLDRELAPGETPAGAELLAHLAGCPDCAALAAAERQLSNALRELRLDPAPPVDVTARVLEGLPALDRAGTGEVSTWQLGWAASAALLCGLALLGTLWRMLPALSGPAQEIWTLALGLRHSLGSLGSAAVTLISAVLKTAGRLLQALAPLAGALQGLEPVVIGGLASCAAIMAGTIVFVVGRDLRSRVSSEKGTTI
jgi:hypothetical protein